MDTVAIIIGCIIGTILGRLIWYWIKGDND